MKLLSFSAILMCGAVAATGEAAPADVKYAPPATWVLPPPIATTGAAPADAPIRFAFTDLQVRIGSEGEETYSAYRMKILKPEALQAGNVTITWSSVGGDATVHRLALIRNGETIDMLKGSRFTVLQREGGLEQSMLDGQLTAVLQVPGLQIGDELDFAATVRRRDPTFGDHSFGLAQLPVQGVPGAFRFKLSWPETDQLRWQASRDLPQAAPAIADGRKSVLYELRDPGGAIMNEGAPARFNIRRLIEYSDFATWSDISKRFWPLFDEASRLPANSPLKAAAKSIADASTNPNERAAAALKLVQDQVRYVYVGLNGGNYRPSSAEETWTRRFGDCKAKTVVLLALLHELGIEAEAVLVDALGGDGTDARLPSPGVFNHVLVRATLGGKTYWLDGTRLGDRYLDQLPLPSFRWALAVRRAGSELEAVAPQALARPQFIDVIDIDATAGIDKSAKVKAVHVLRQDSAYAIRVQLAGLSAEDADRAQRAYWRQQLDWVEADRVSWRYDERQATLLLTLVGEGKPEWKGGAREGHRFYLPGAGFVAPDRRRRPKEQDQTAPWANDFPGFRCWATTVRLPAAPAQWRWDYYAEPMQRNLGGTAFWRASGLRGNVLRTVMSRNIYLAEISAAEANALNDGLAGFNNNMSSVYEEKASAGENRKSDTLPFQDDADWVEDASQCAAPKSKQAG